LELEGCNSIFGDKVAILDGAKMTNLLHWQIAFQRLDLKYTWAISRNATDFKVNAFVTVSDGIHTGIGEAAPNVRYGESPELFEKVFEDLSLQGFQTLEGLARLLKATKSAQCSSVWHRIGLCTLSMCSKADNCRRLFWACSAGA
jgi:hypothetical protein